MKALSTIEKATMISNEIKRKIGYDCIIDILDNNGHIVTFCSVSLITYEIEKLIQIKNDFENNFQIYATKAATIETVFIIKPKPIK